MVSAPLGWNPIAPEDEEIRASFPEVFGAAFRQYNTLGSLLSAGLADPRVEGDFDPFEQLQGTPYEVHARAFVGVDSPREFERVKAAIDREEEDRSILYRGGWMSTAAGLSAGILDPINLVPLGGVAVRSFKIGRSMLEGGLATARAGFVGMTAAEAILQASQHTRTFQESAVNVAAGTVMAGLLGSGIRGVTSAAFVRRANGLLRDMMDLEKIDLVNDPTPVAGGSSSIPMDVLERQVGDAVEGSPIEEHLVKGGKLLSKLPLLSRMGPKLDTLLHGKSKTEQRWMRELVDNPFYDRENFFGVATPQSIESTYLAHWHGVLLDLEEQQFKDYIAYRFRLAGKSLPEGALAYPRRVREAIRELQYDRNPANLNRLTYRQFREQVGVAANDEDFSGISEVTASAKRLRANVFDPLAEAGMEVGIFGENMLTTGTKGAKTYFPVVYNETAMRKRPEDFLKMAVGWLRTQDIEAIEAGRGARSTRQSRALALAEGGPEDTAISVVRSEEELLTEARSIYDTILGTNRGRLHFGVFPASGATKERVFLPSFHHKRDFIELDSSMIAARYIHSIVPDIALARRYGLEELRAGFPTLFGKIREEYADLIEKATSERAKVAIGRQRDRSIANLQSVLDQLRNTHAMPEDTILTRFVRGAKRYSYITLGGPFGINSITDVGNVLLTARIDRAFRAPLAAFRRGLVKSSAREARRMGVGGDLLLRTAGRRFSDIADDYGKGNFFEKALGVGSEVQAHASLLAPWNSFAKGYAGIVFQDDILFRILRRSEGKGKRLDEAQLRHLGIDSKLEARILAERAHWDSEEGVFLSNTEAWSDKDAAFHFRAALRKLVNEKGVVEVGPGDLPRAVAIQNTTLGILGPLFTQFKGFAIATTSRILLSHMQVPQARLLSGLLAGTTLGMMVAATRQRLRDGNWEEVSQWEARHWVAEGIDRFGILGIASEAYNISDKMAGGALTKLVTGGPTLSRYQTRTAPAAIFGPAYNLVEASFAAGRGAAAIALPGEPVAAADLKALRRILPFQNHFALIGLLDQLEEGLGQTFNIPKRRPR